jgi:hypothetical protein
MCAKSFCKVSRLSCVTEACGIARELVRRECRGPGDTENAMRRLATRYGLPWRLFWSLRYRPPSDLFVTVRDALFAAHAAECARQERLLRHEIEITKIKAGAEAAAVAAAEAVVDQNNE